MKTKEKSKFGPMKLVWERPKGRVFNVVWTVILDVLMSPTKGNF